VRASMAGEDLGLTGPRQALGAPPHGPEA
jgi:hypothetical protein